MGGERAWYILTAHAPTFHTLSRYTCTPCVYYGFKVHNKLDNSHTYEARKTKKKALAHNFIVKRELEGTHRYRYKMQTFLVPVGSRCHGEQVPH